MKYSVLSLGIASVALLSACDHYSERLAAMDSQFTQPPAAMTTSTVTTTTVHAQNDAALANITPAAGDAGPAPAGQPFNLALAQAYYDRAVKEKEHMDHSAAHYFTSKAEAALRGETPEPAMPADFGIERSDSEAMMKERAKLMAAIAQYKNTDRQAALVKAQVDYDGWLDQAAENKTGPALTCREGFIEAMDLLDGAQAETRRYGIFFTPGQQVLSDGAQTIIDDVADFVQENRGRAYQVTLIEKTPSTVSAQRIAAVQAALAAKGVQPGSVAPAPAAAVAPNGLLASPAAPENEGIEVVVAFEGSAPAPQTLAPAAGVPAAPAPVIAPQVQPPAPTLVVPAAPTQIVPSAPVRRSPYQQ